MDDEDKPGLQRLRAEMQLSGWRHFIGADEIKCGDIIEVLQGDDWIQGRYEANLHASLSKPEAYLEIDEQHLITLSDGMIARRA